MPNKTNTRERPIPRKPTAIVSTSFANALQWVINSHNKVEEYSNATHCIRADGEDFVVITHPDQALEFEFAKYYVATMRDYPKLIEEIVCAVKARVR